MRVVSVKWLSVEKPGSEERWEAAVAEAPAAPLVGVVLVLSVPLADAPVPPMREAPPPAAVKTEEVSVVLVLSVWSVGMVCVGEVAAVIAVSAFVEVFALGDNP